MTRQLVCLFVTKYTSGIVPWGKYSISRNSYDNVDDEETAVKCIGGGGTNIVFHFTTSTPPFLLHFSPFKNNF